MKRKKALACVLLMSALTAISCAKEQKQKSVAVHKPQEKGIIYTTAQAAYDDISVTDEVDCTYMQTKSYDLSFGLGEHQVRSIDVKQGDLVTKGQLLCSLDVEDMQEQIPQFAHEYASSALKLQQQRELLEFDKSMALDTTPQEVEKQYRDTIGDLQDAVTISAARLAEAKEQVQEGMIYAPVTGVATYVSNLVEGSYSKAGETVVTVSDLSECCFQTEGIKHMEAFEEGKTYDITLSPDETVYEVTPFEKERWEKEGNMRFHLTDDTASADFGATGQIAVSLGQKEHVLCVPSEALHTIGDGYYVYLLEDGVRRMQPVSIGLSGEDKTEITGGLKEKDVVVLHQAVGGGGDDE